MTSTVQAANNIDGKLPHRGDVGISRPVFGWEAMQ
jgi:hypothetical protein